MRVLALIAALVLTALLTGCASTGSMTAGTTTRLSDARPYDEPREPVVNMSQVEFRGLALIPGTYGKYSCRKSGGVDYCVGPRDIYAKTLQCTYTRNGKWRLSNTLPFPEAYICTGTSFPRLTNTYTYEFEFSL